MNKESTRKFNLEDIEAILEGSLQQVSPRPEFVRKLRQRLIDFSRPTVDVPKINSFQYVLLALAGIAGGALFLVTGTRAVLSLLGALGVVHYLRKQQDEQKHFSTSGPIYPA